MTKWLAGAACKDITPSEVVLQRGVWIAGFGPNRRAVGIHDPITVRALVLEKDERCIALLVGDLVGFLYNDVLEVRRRCRQLLPQIELLWVISTHNHEGPDTIGIWGPNLTTSGVDAEWLEEVRTNMVACVEEAYRSRRPASLHLGRTMAPGVCRDLREPCYLDEEMIVLEAIDEDGNSIASLVNYSNHPESLGDENPYVSADYPHWLRKRVEQERGGICIYTTGALGGMTAPRPPSFVLDPDGRIPVRNGPAQVEEGFEATAKMGEYLGERALVALRKARQESDSGSLWWESQLLQLPVDNANFSLFLRNGILPSGGRFCMIEGQQTAKTEVGVLQIGRLSLASVPGELFPEMGTMIKDALPGEYSAILGLANDELGYFVPEVNPFTGLRDYCPPTPTGERGKRGHYEETMCVHRTAARRIVDTICQLAVRIGNAQ